MDIKTIPIGPLQTNCYLVACPETHAAVLIDPAWSGEKLYELVQDEGVELAAILLTHAHFDHVGGAADLKRSSSARLLAHPDSGPLLAEAHRHALLGTSAFTSQRPGRCSAETRCSRMVSAGAICQEGTLAS
jgi:glyoxylase-like metal-dependent hydrolase (beta-lactamase superfamily II)